MSDIDKLFKDGLKDYTSAYPDDMWKRIEKRLPSKKRKGFGLWFIFGGAMLVGTVALFLMVGDNGLFNEKTNQKTDHANVLSEKIASNEKSENNQTPGQYDGSNESESESENTNNNNTLAASTNSYTPTQNNNLSYKNNNLFSQALSSGDEESEIQYSDTNENQLALKSELSTEAKENSDSEAPKFLISKPNSGKFVDISRTVNSPAALGNTLSLADFDRDNSLLEYRVSNSRSDCPSFKKSAPGFYADMYYSHEYGIRSLTSNSLENNYRDYINIRNDSERALYSFSSGLRLSFVLPGGIALKTGLNYTQINERFKWVDPESIGTRTITIRDTIYNMDGSISEITEETQVIQLGGSREIKTYNRYKMLDIPLLLGYEFGEENSRMYYSVNAGVLVNILFRQKGRFFDLDGEPVWFTSGQDNAYEAFDSSAGLSLYGSFGIHYKWTHGVDLILEPNFRYYMKSISLDSYELSQKYLTVGLITGIRYNF